MGAEERDEVLSQLSNMVWSFQSSPSVQSSNLDNKAESQAKLYENIDPETDKAIITTTHRPNCVMHDIITLVNLLPVHFLRRNEIDKDIMMF